MSPTTEKSQSPFLDLSSFSAEEAETIVEQKAPSTWYEVNSPFRSVYEMAGQEDMVSPEADEFASFLAELHDREFDEAIFELVNEAADLYESRFEGEYGGLAAQSMQAERMLAEHFEPLVRELETLLETVANDIEGRSFETMTEAEIDAFIDQYQPTQPLSPSFENLWGWVKNKIKKAANWVKDKGKALAKKAFQAALGKLKKYMRPWLNKIVQFAINKLPAKYRPLAKLLAQRLGLQKEIEGGETETLAGDKDATGEVAQLQQEFDLVFANLLFAEDEAQQEFMLAEVISDSRQPAADPLGDLERARSQFIQGLRQLEEGEDPTPLLENFLPAVLPLVKLGLKFYGRPKLVKFLAKYIEKLIKRFIPPQYLRPLSQAIVDAGLRLINLEATSDDAQQVALEAVADTVEDTVRRVATLPEYILDNEDLLEGFVLEAFEEAATRNFPPVLPDRVYQERPELRETTGVSGTWVRQPLQGKRYYKKYTRVFDVNITPHMAHLVRTWQGVPLGTVIQEGYGLPGGRMIKARVHLYEAVPGTWLSRISKYEKNVAGLGTPARLTWSKILPLTPQAAAAILGQPRLGRDVPAKYLADPLMIGLGQRFYYLEIPEAPAQMLSSPGAPAASWRCCQTHLTLDFPRDQLQVSIFLSEAMAQGIAMKLRQRAPLGPILTSLRSVFAAGLETAFAEGAHHQVKIVHGAMAIEQSPATALKWLPPLVQEMLVDKLILWLGYHLSQYLQQRPHDFITATENLATGLTIIITFNNPPGLADIRRILAGQPVVVRGLKFPEGMPEAHVRIIPGYWHG
jgi:hypothetical protein